MNINAKDLIGKKIGSVLINSIVGNDYQGRSKISGICDCGESFIFRTEKIKKMGDSFNCGCEKIKHKNIPRKSIDMVGIKYGFVTLLSIKKDKQGRSVFVGLCDCGKTCAPRKDYINKRYKDLSCGCRKGVGYEERFKKDKEKKTEIYRYNNTHVKLKSRDSKLKVKYGIDLEKYNEMHHTQGGKCLICKRHQDDFFYSLGRLVVDHCHKTLKIRGLLCRNCNSGISLLKDDVDVLKNAIIYLNEFNNETGGL